ncbi:MAG: FtsX-like permease family protein [Oceanospirillaceae bacterium]
MSPTLRLAGKQIRSQWRKADWLTLILSLFMMTTLVTLLTTTSDRLYSSLTDQSADIMGADLVFRSQQPISPLKQQQVLDSKLISSAVTQFVSMAEAGDNNVLSTIRAVTDTYPVRGKIITEPQANTNIPATDTIWVDKSLLSRLEIKLNDKVFLGYAQFRVSNIVVDSPDRGRGMANFNPQIIMRSDQLKATGILAPGSRARYRLLVKGDEQSILNLQQLWKADLIKGQRIINARDDRELNGGSIANASRYLKLSALLSLLLGAVAILLSLQRYSSDQRRRSALLLNLGMTPKQLIFIYSFQLFIGWLIAAVAGTAVGLFLHQFIASQIGEFLPHISSLSLASVITSPLLALAILFILGLPTLLPLGRVSILQMLRKEQQNNVSRWHYFACAMLLLTAISLYMGSIVLAAVITLLLLVLGWISGYFAQHILVFLVKKLQGRIALAPLLTLRLRQQRHWHRLQAGVFSLLLAIMAVLFFVRNDLIEQWQGQIPKDSPNHFAINIQPWEKDRLATWMLDQNIPAKLFPIVRGRITQINETPIAQALNSEQAQTHALRRELNTTWQQELSKQNTVIKGEWNPDVAGVSIERELSEDLGLKLGDTLGLSVAGQILSVPITSVREVDWESFRPNFFLIYTPKLLEQFPYTFITSFKIPEEELHKSSLLVKAFPTITLIDIDKIFKQAQGVINKLADSASLVMFLTVISGALMLLTILQQELAQRRYEGALLQTLGASERQTRQLDMLEFCLLGITCGSIAAFVAELLLAIMSARFFDLPITAHPLLWIALPIIATITFSGIGNLVRGKLSLADCYGLIKAS